MCGKTRIYFFKRRVHRVEAYRTYRFFHSPKIAASGALCPRRRAFTARLAPAQAPHRCRRRRCQRHPHMPRHADSLAVPVYFTRVPMHEQPRGASAVSPAFPRNASCVPPTRLRRSHRFVGAHRRLPYRREDHRKFVRGRKAHKGTGGAAVICFCTAPGYAFAAAYTGSLLLRSDRIGLNLFFACALAPLLLGLTLSRFAEKPEKSLKSPESAPGGIVSAVQDGIKATVSLCGFVLVFSMLLAVLHDAGIFQFLCGFLSRLGLTVPLSGALLTMGLEITAGVSQCVYWHLPVYFLAFGLGFSGVCIHLQIFSFFHKAGLPLSKTRYVLARFLNGLLSAAFYLLLSYFLPANTSVAVETSPLNTAPMAGSAASSLALIALSVFFLLTCILRSGKTPSKICGGNSTGKMLQ